MWHYNQEVGFVQNKEFITSKKGLTAHEYTDAEKDALFTSGLPQAHDNAGRLYCVEPEPAPEPGPLSLAEARAAKLADLRAVRLAAEYGGFMLYGRKWDSELKDEQRLTSMVTLMKETGMASFDGWKIAEGVYLTLTFELALEAAVAMFAHYTGCFAEEARIAAEINALSGVSAVEAYSIEFNIQGEA